MKRVLTSLVACLVAISIVVPTNAVAAGKCAKDSHPGGDWPSFGGDLQNTRSQDAKQVPTPDDLTTRLPKWKLSVAQAGAGGNFQSTPVVANGCIYIATSTGWVIAANADTGEPVWSRTLVGSENLAFLGGIFALTVEDGKVFVQVGANGRPFAAALDPDTGKILWRTIITKEEGAFTNASPVIIDDLWFIGLSGPEDMAADAGRHPGGYAILDTDTGRIVAREYLIPKKDDERGIKGASVWATAAYDSQTRHLFVGTGQPANKSQEHTLTNAIIKIDMNRGPTFGKIVDSYKGDHDVRADIDFGGSPTLIRDSKGRSIVVEIQKSGRLHALYADTMEQAWWNRVGGDPVGYGFGNSGTGAFDGKAYYITANPTTSVNASSAYALETKEPTPGYLYSLNPDNGTINWKTPVAGGIEYHLLSTAGGVVYIVTTHGVLLGLDASNGLPVFARSLAADAQDGCVNLSSGAIVARNTVYATCDVGGAGGGWIVAY